VTVPLEEIEAGQVFGWSWLFQPFTWHFRARALEDCRLTVLNGASLLAVAEENHSFGYELMKRITRLLIRRLDSARQRLLDQARAGRRI
jgi:CRP-like cAMP-binding protein